MTHSITWVVLWIHPDYHLPILDINEELTAYHTLIERLEESPVTGLLQIPNGILSMRTGREQMLREFNTEATKRLGSRYQVWTGSRFIDGNQPDHVTKLRELFPQPPYERVMVFGKEPLDCPHHQAHNHLGAITTLVQVFDSALPNKLHFPTLKNPRPKNRADYTFKP